MAQARVLIAEHRFEEAVTLLRFTSRSLARQPYDLEWPHPCVTWVPWDKLPAEPKLWHLLDTAEFHLAKFLRGEPQDETERLERSVAALREALKERTRDRVPLDWAMIVVGPLLQRLRTVALQNNPAGVTMFAKLEGHLIRRSCRPILID